MLKIPGTDLQPMLLSADSDYCAAVLKQFVNSPVNLCQDVADYRPERRHRTHAARHVVQQN
jgi:hypothetical protein